jgi:hypothetical protein
LSLLYQSIDIIIAEIGRDHQAAGSLWAFVSQSSGSIITVTVRSLATPSRSSTSVTCPAVV